jgi:hypothetical protein
MSSALVHAGRLKPDVRLAQAISHFVADLSAEQKQVFNSYREQACSSAPSISDVMRLTAEIDRSTSGRGGRCFGPRLTNILQSIQQYAAIGDVIVGGSQNLIACGVWSLARLTIQVSSTCAIYERPGSFDICIATSQLLDILRGHVKPAHGRWPICSSVSRDG